ncbi:MAG: T9SS type A sorting domain-containing protein [Chitinophagales bacterium]|nr:T9SS type A sorting domain-containing protein [Chitinophagales bacterium]MCZ2394873.1 T9SS type A sorting domain-containing protein [Chitinophagales bacterium]
MKKILFFTFILFQFAPSIVKAGYFNNTLQIDGVTRDFRVYLPQNYSPDQSYSLVIGIHGLGDNMTNFANAFWEFKEIADSQNIILAFPQGTDNLILGTGWNAAAGNLGIYPSEQYNDVGFIDSLTDKMQREYPIIKEKTYLFGFSNGGFMVQRMACQSNERYAAIASIAGTIGNKVYDCNPSRTLPILHFHGTADLNVGYTINLFGINVDELLKKWQKINGCDPTPISINIPNTKVDGYFVTQYVYQNCNERLEFFKIHNADHILLNAQKNDISYSEVMWNFFNPPIVPTAIKENLSSASINIFPIPTRDKINIQMPPNIQNNFLNISIFDYTGKQVYHSSNNISGIHQIDCSQLPNGMYLITATDGQQLASEKFIVQH